MDEKAEAIPRVLAQALQACELAGLQRLGIEADTQRIADDSAVLEQSHHLDAIDQAAAAKPGIHRLGHDMIAERLLRIFGGGVGIQE
ncbi:MAG: hypothetical protein J0L61_03530 [Planctomycetes bacterium]|nr:hypothetical protein [Planctomycetota bacterium]